MARWIQDYGVVLLTVALVVTNAIYVRLIYRGQRRDEDLAQARAGHAMRVMRIELLELQRYATGLSKNGTTAPFPPLELASLPLFLADADRIDADVIGAVLEAHYQTLAMNECGNHAGKWATRLKWLQPRVNAAVEQLSAALSSSD